MTRVVNLRRSGYDVYIGRAGHGHDGYFGNPFPLESEAKREECLEKYRVWFMQRIDSDAAFKARVEELRGKRLGCFCAPKLCHGDVIADYLEGRSDAAPTVTFTVVEPL